VRRLFGDGKGSFRTRGRTAAATVRGTRWGTQDRCDGTLVIVQRGRVSVRDLVRHRTVLVRAGHAYLARRRG
jgi:ferric-dicitrate binding protein FerR (iron transport regulator)